MKFNITKNKKKIIEENIKDINETPKCNNVKKEKEIINKI